MGKSQNEVKFMKQKVKVCSDKKSILPAGHIGKKQNLYLGFYIMVMDSVNTTRTLGNQAKLVPLEHNPS